MSPGHTNDPLADAGEPLDDPVDRAAIEDLERTPRRVTGEMAKLGGAARVLGACHLLLLDLGQVADGVDADGHFQDMKGHVFVSRR